MSLRSASPRALILLVALNTTALLLAAPAAGTPLPQQAAIGADAEATAAQTTEVSAETVPALITDRPDFTESGVTVPRGMWQLEFGYTFTREPGVKTHEPGEALLRVGLNERVELRLGLGGFTRVSGAGDAVSGRSDTSIGAKISLLTAGESGSSRPDLAIIVQTDLPSGSSTLRQDQPAFGFTLAAGRDLTERLSLGVNAGYLRNTDDQDQRFDQATGSIALGYSLTETVGAYLEAFAFSATSAAGDASSFVNAGLTLLLSQQLQLDARAGHGLNGHGSDFFAGLGASIRW